ncbi:ATP-binding protein [Fibrobacter sp.]
MNGFEVSSGIWFETEFNSIKKSKDQLRPVYEAFTNAWESLAESTDDDKFINVDLYQTSNPMGDNSFDKIIIEDNGIGLNDDNYDRLKTLRKNTKGKLNKGTGRVQYLHFFGKTKIESVYLKDGEPRKKILELSKSQVFLLNQAFIKVISDEPTSESRKTKVVFSDPLKDKDGQFYGTLNLCDMKERLVMHYTVLLCQQRNALPKITLRLFVDNQQKESLTVDQSDIPDLDHIENFEVNYATVENKEIVKQVNKESFCFRSFKIEQEKLPKNSLFLISKNEVVDKKINLPIPEKDNFDGFRYLFFISGDYLDNNDSDSRGSVQLYSEKELKKAVGEGDLLDEEYITVDALEASSQRIVEKTYPVFNEKKQAKILDLEKLKEMFLLDDAMVEDIKSSISLDADDEDILSKIYKSESKKIANIDAKIAETKKNVEKLDPTSDDYVDTLKTAAEELTKQIPMQNKNELSKYVARRKIVLDVFQKILEEEEKRQKNGKAIDEDVLHNLIFQQHSQDTENSDLWLINEEYIYFQGSSESFLSKLTYNGQRVLKESLTDEETEYRRKLGEDAFAKRTDVLLFPKEGKCIIIEFKAPDVNVSDHLQQISRYASIINNLSKDEFKIHSFYGYLIGEKINDDDVFEHDGRYKKSEFYDYLYQLDIPVFGKFGRAPGTLNMEVIKYSTILERAKNRNQIFINKLTGKDL